MSGTKIPNVSNLFRETKHFNSCVRINACVTQFLKIRATSSTIPGIARVLLFTTRACSNRAWAVVAKTTQFSVRRMRAVDEKLIITK